MTAFLLNVCQDICSHARTVAQIFCDTYGADRVGDAELVAKLCSSPFCFGLLAHLKGIPAGFILLQQAVDTAEILEFCVSPTVQRNGIGKQLLSESLHCATHRKIKKTTLEVATTNEAAVVLYRSAGFETIARRPEYYRHKTEKIDALVMEYRH